MILLNACNRERRGLWGCTKSRLLAPTETLQGEIALFVTRTNCNLYLFTCSSVSKGMGVKATRF